MSRISSLSYLFHGLALEYKEGAILKQIRRYLPLLATLLIVAGFLSLSFQNCSGSQGGFSANSLEVESVASAPSPHANGTFSYAWVSDSWSACSSLCGGGTQTRNMSCMASDASKVADTFCSDVKPPSTQSCNTQACTSVMWIQSGFGPCSVTCGGGTQTQTVSCQNSTGQVIAESLCTGTKPTNTRSCNSQACPTDSGSSPYANIQIRMSRPVIVRQTGNDELDSQTPHVKLKNGQWRTFTSEFNAYAIDGQYAWNVTGNRVQVLNKNGSSFGNPLCGRWLNAIIPDPANGRLIGFIHEERMVDCSVTPYNPLQSMVISFSYDEGLTWSNPWNPGSPGATILGATGPDNNTDTREAADCGAIKGNANDIYLYCHRRVDGASIVAHASMSDLSPAGWKKYYKGSFSEPGINGQASPISDSSVGLIPVHFKQLGLYGIVQWKSYDGITGLNLSISTDFVHFNQNAFSSGLVMMDIGASWTRPSPYEAITYLGAFTSYEDGTNEVNNSGFVLNYVYFPPGSDVNTKFLVMQEISITTLPSAALAQVGTEITRWQNTSSGRYRSTTGPVPGNYDTWSYDLKLGYVLTAPSPNHAVTKLEECKSNWTEEYLTTTQGACDPKGYNHYRTVGWVFQKQEAGTIPLYRCWSAKVTSHFISNRVDCEGKGNMEALLGYALEQ